MPPFFIRSTIFNLCFYILTAISCIVMLPTLFLPRAAFLNVVRGFVHITAFLEKYILGLSYEVRGKEYLPKEGAYIIAAKHQSAYETFKLHILFNDPAIVLKKELLKIPLWGKYLAKSNVIAIDRSSPKMAIKSIKEEAQRVSAQNRAMVIFPQGTRVAPETSAKEKPYKIGVVRMQEATGLPIIPMALNTGIFYPKHKWCKKAGRVIFEFLPPINPSDNASSVLNRIEMTVEEKTARLMEEGKKSIPAKTSKYPAIFAFILLTAYTMNWFIAASIAKRAVIDALEQIKTNPQIIDYQISEPKIHGFPLKLKLSMDKQFIKTSNGKISIASIKAQSWALMGMPIDIKTGEIKISMTNWKGAISFEALDSQIIFQDNILDIKYARLIKSQTRGQVSGQIDFSTQTYPDVAYPNVDLSLKLVNIDPVIEEMLSSNIIKPKAAMFASIALKSLEKEGVISSSITSQGNKLYLGPIKILELPPIRDE